jgi:hypothetical protein
MVKFWSVLFENSGCNSESHMHVNIMIIVDQRKCMEASLLTAIGFWIQGLVMSQTGNQLRVLWIVSVLLRKFHLASEDMEFIVLHNDFYYVSLMIWMNEFMVSLPLNLWSFCCQSHLCLCSKPLDSFLFFCDVAVDRVCGSDGVTYWWVNLSLQFSSQCNWNWNTCLQVQCCWGEYKLQGYDMQRKNGSKNNSWKDSLQICLFMHSILNSGVQVWSSRSTMCRSGSGTWRLLWNLEGLRWSGIHWVACCSVTAISPYGAASSSRLANCGRLGMTSKSWGFWALNFSEL